MKIVAFEGIDASGKETQAKRLKEALEYREFKVAMESFPRYENPIGQLIKGYLRGDVNLSDKGFHSLYEADRLDYLSEIEKLEMKGYDYLISDRFTMSNLAFGVAKGIDYKWLRNLQKNIPDPDITFVLDIPPNISMKRKKEGRDLYEIDDSLLNRARSAYVVLADKLFKDEDTLVYTIDGTLDKEVIHSQVLSYVLGIFENEKPN